MKPTLTQMHALQAAVERGCKIEKMPGRSANHVMFRKMLAAGWIREDGTLTSSGKAIGIVRRRAGQWYVLPGNGPWKIDEGCLSEKHNTTFAMRGYIYSDGGVTRGRIACTCPRSLALRAEWNKQVRESQRIYYRKARRPMPQWWSGPWLILENCPAVGHNAISRAMRGPLRERCICPHARALLELHWASEATKKRERSKRKSGRRSIPITAPISGLGVKLYGAPDFTEGGCRKPGGQALFDKAMGNDAIARREAVKVCIGCPLREKCARWVMQEEGKNPGSWGGIWGGLSPRDRKRLRDGASAVHATESDVRSAAGAGVGDEGEGGADGEARGGASARQGSGVPGKRAYPHRRSIRTAQ